LRQLAGISGENYYNNFYSQFWFDVDHIYPENLGSDSPFIQSISNVALLGLHDNRALKDKHFESQEKQDAKSKSDILTTRAVNTSP
tara:strand:- start:3195 stop:3452 length:258 start_codon:yes stop_codon:yes gene_type:complete